jgi:hypothetical protein
MADERSTTERGNDFRDQVFGLLNAAGFHGDKEVRRDYKKADAAVVWSRDSFDGPVRYLVETKDYRNPLNKNECQTFVTEYLGLIRGGHADRAWLISRGDISPDGRALVDAHARDGLKCFTFENFQRNLLQLDRYLRDIIAEYHRSEIDRFYVRPTATEGGDLETVVSQWIDEVGAPPLAVLGGYGQGKSTFALHFAAAMAEEALHDPTKRVPILVPLGEIVDDQAIDGLIGKVLASRYRVDNYHFHLFEALNSAGRFVIIFDGLDEMKHGMTLHAFERNMAELMRLDRVKAKILILGRDTVFQNDIEFRSIILGRQRTAAGREVSARDRRACRPIEICGFTLTEARSFVERYFPWRVQEAARENGRPSDTRWMAARTIELADAAFDSLIVRPVHAQMLCDIATEPDVRIKGVAKFELYDTFVHYLIDREVKKRGRYGGFGIDVRRRFNSAVAWWLWEQGGASTTTLMDVPAKLCKEAVRGIDHDFDEAGLKRELTTGCLVAKAGGTIFFGHRSIQEFLVAEYLFDSNLLFRSDLGRGEFAKICGLVNTEVIDFLTGRVTQSSDNSVRAQQWLEQLDGWVAIDVPIKGFDLFVQVARAARLKLDRWRSPWHLWIGFFLANSTSFRALTRPGAAYILDTISTANSKSGRMQAAALALWALSSLRCTFSIERSVEDMQFFAQFVARWLPRDNVKQALAEVYRGKSVRVQVRRDEAVLWWGFLAAADIDRNDATKELRISVDLLSLEDEMAVVLGMGFAPDEIGIEATLPRRDCSLAQVYRAMADLSVREREIDAIRPFFNDESLRARIMPLVVQRKRGRRWKSPSEPIAKA